MSTAYTAEETRDQFLQTLRSLAEYWAETGKTHREVADGLVFSILVMLDGGNMSLPAFKVTVDPHEDDMAYHSSRGERWFEPGMSISDLSLHELWNRYSLNPANPPSHDP